MAANPRSFEIRVDIVREDDIIAARQLARTLARDLGFGPLDQSRIATAVSELTRNVVRYATDGKGQMVARPVRGGLGQEGIEIIVSDDGPGIPDVAQAFGDGFTSGLGLGLGLPGTKRLMDEMTVDSALGRGTVVTIRRWLR